MAEPAIALGAAVGPFAATLDADLVSAFARATQDPFPAVREGSVVPPVALATQLWEAQDAGRPALVSAELQAAATGGVHGEHDVVLHRPIEPGEPLQLWVEGHGARPAGRNALVTLRYSVRDADDRVVAEQWWTTVFLGVGCEPVGHAAPAHAFPEGARTSPVGGVEIDVDPDMARRYAEVSGDWSDHHFDAEAAQRSGAPAPFLHGLCTMALCAQAVTGLVADGDPRRVRRVAVRFAAPVLLGEQLLVEAYDAGGGGFAFEATSAGGAVVTHGRVELHPQGAG